MKRVKIWVTSLCALCQVAAFAQQEGDVVVATPLREVVLTATKFRTLASRTGKTIIKITSAELRQQPDKSVAQLLDEQVGLQLNGSRMPVGTNQSYYMRGGRSRNTLILIDGMPVYDPSGVEPTFDLNLIQTDQVASIEILEGGASALYGSGAASGVINIILNKAGRKAIQGTARLSAASYDTYSQGLSLDGRLDRFRYFVSLDNFKTVGISAAKDTLGAGFDKDGSEKQGLLARFGYPLSRQLDMDFSVLHNQLLYDYDGGSYTDLDYTSAAPRGENAHTALALQTRFKHQGGALQLKASYGFYAKDFQRYDPAVKAYNDWLRYDSQSAFAELIERYRIDSNWHLLLGLSYCENSFDQRQAAKPIASSDTMRVHITAPYAAVRGHYGAFDINAGLRYSRHSAFGGFYTYNLSPSYTFGRGPSKWVVHSSLSNAYIAPTLSQLYAKSSGNAALKPETSLSWEAGLTRRYRERLKLDAVFFYRDERHPISYIDGKDVNLAARAQVKGIEASVRYLLDKCFELGGNYTYTHRTTVPGLRIPANRFNARLRLNPFAGNAIRLTYQYTSSRTDLYFGQAGQQEAVRLSSYSLFDLSVSQKFLKQRLTLFAALNNLFDVDYQEIVGYNSFGRNFYTGLTYRF